MAWELVRRCEIKVYIVHFVYRVIIPSYDRETKNLLGELVLPISWRILYAISPEKRSNNVDILVIETKYHLVEKSPPCTGAFFVQSVQQIEIKFFIVWQRKPR